MAGVVLVGRPAGVAQDQVGPVARSSAQSGAAEGPASTRNWPSCAGLAISLRHEPGRQKQILMRQLRNCQFILSSSQLRPIVRKDKKQSRMIGLVCRKSQIEFTYSMWCFGTRRFAV